MSKRSIELFNETYKLVMELSEVYLLEWIEIAEVMDCNVDTLRALRNSTPEKIKVSDQTMNKAIPKLKDFIKQFE